MHTITFEASILPDISYISEKIYEENQHDNIKIKSVLSEKQGNKYQVTVTYDI
jgi:hypothetical protein